MMRSHREVRVKVANAELDALEDILFCVLTDREYTKAHRLAKKLWIRLCRAYDTSKATGRHVAP